MSPIKKSRRKKPNKKIKNISSHRAEINLGNKENVGTTLMNITVDPTKEEGVSKVIKTITRRTTMEK